MQTRTVRVRVPGTSANCGPGFDAIGVACTVYNEMELTLTSEPQLSIEIEGEGAANIPTDDRNIVWKSIGLLLRRAKRAKEYRGAVIRMQNDIPLSRGLGSSAAAIVAGLKAANLLLEEPFTRRDLLDMATEIEGHPDNVAPALFGGFTVSVKGRRRVDCFAFQPKLPLKLVVAVPDFPLSTKMARSVLPTEVPLQDAIFNIGRAAMLVAALSKGNPHFLRTAFDDALHQPYREKLIPGMRDVFRAARHAGAIGATISGAGPCLMAFTLDHETQVGNAMIEAFRRHDVRADVLQLAVDTSGVVEIGTTR